jgi:hypothetical protein
VYLYGTNNPPGGFQIAIPADAAPRQLKLYVGLYGCAARLDAWLSDWSALPFSDLSVSNVYQSSYAVYTLTFSSPNPGTVLNVTWTPTQMFDANFGNVTWQAATLAPAPTVLRLKGFLVPESNEFNFQFRTATNKNYNIWFTDSLGSPNWQLLTNVSGDGADAIINCGAADPEQRFYRVQVE